MMLHLEQVESRIPSRRILLSFPAFSIMIRGSSFEYLSHLRSDNLPDSSSPPDVVDADSGESRDDDADDDDDDDPAALSAVVVLDPI